MIDSKLIASLRQVQGMSQQKLAELSHLSLVTIYKIESGNQSLRTDTLAAIALALGVRATDLFMPEEPGPNTKVADLIRERQSSKKEQR